MQIPKMVILGGSRIYCVIPSKGGISRERDGLLTVATLAEELQSRLKLPNKRSFLLSEENANVVGVEFRRLFRHARNDTLEILDPGQNDV